jgi:hypothetical protein
LSASPIESSPELANEPGYLGLVLKAGGVDWDLVARYGPCVMVEPRSPAWMDGLRSGDFITTINHQPFAAFHANPPSAGTPYAVVAYRKGLGTIRTFGTVGTTPKPKQAPAWQKSPSVIAGKRVEKNERPAFLGWLSTRRNLRSCDKVLIHALIEFDGRKGILPKHNSIAKHLGCSVRSVKRWIERCRHFGILRVESGKCSWTSNTYTVCWPAGYTFKPRAETRAEVTSLATPKAVRLADELLKIVGLDRDDRRSRGAVGIVDGWLARGWDCRIILTTVKAVMRQRKEAQGDDWLPNTITYFERPIRNSHGG